MYRMRPAVGRYFLRTLVLLLLGWFAPPSAHGQGGIIVHEYIPPDPAEDLALGALTPSGTMPAAIRTPSGLVSAPDPFRSPHSTREPTYGKSESSGAKRFQIDGATSDPGTLHYHEPFRPSIAPFKRLAAYDAVNESFELVVRDTTSRTVALNNSPGAGDDEFFGDISVVGGRSVRIPSVAAGMRVLAADLEPPVPFQIAVDSAENWYFQSPTLIGTGRLIMRLAASRAAMSPDVVANSYAKLASALPPVPEVVVRAALPVLEQIGVSRVTSPTDAVRAMVAYFRSFVPSTKHLTESSGRELYQRLALSRKGVCRHRAYAFVVTSLALGIPARMVHNEAHAWVEAYDGRDWHRIDLGGAASSFDYDGEKPSGPPYRMPVDHYEWPASSSPAAASLPATSQGQVQTGTGSGQTTEPSQDDSQQRESTQREPQVPSTTPSGTSATPTEHASSAAAAGDEPAASATAQPPTAERPVARITFALKGDSNVHRGEPLTLEGDAKSETGGCVRTRVDFGLRRGREHLALGATTTDGRGHFALQTTVPMNVGVGPYEVTATASESEACEGNALW